MQIEIQEVAVHPQGLVIKAIVFPRRLPPPIFKEDETDEHYRERVEPIAKDIDSFYNLHTGPAELKQALDIMVVPTVADYCT